LPSAPANDPEAAPPAAAAAANWPPKNGAPGPLAVVVQFCAKAPELVETAVARAMPAKIRPLPTVNRIFMNKPPNSKRQNQSKGGFGILNPTIRKAAWPAPKADRVVWTAWHSRIPAGVPIRQHCRDRGGNDLPDTAGRSGRGRSREDRLLKFAVNCAGTVCRRVFGLIPWT
jgi:hypothetical protein